MVQEEWEVLVLPHAAFSERAGEKAEISQISIKKWFEISGSDFQIYFLTLLNCSQIC